MKVSQSSVELFVKTGSVRLIRRPNKLIRFWLFQAWPVFRSFHFYPESKGENFHDALEREEARERRVEVVQRDLVRLRLFVILVGKEDQFPVQFKDCLGHI